MRSLPQGLALVAVLCGTALAKPAWRPPPPRTDAVELTDRLEDAIRRHDAAAVRSLFAEPIQTNGLWFPDASCAKQFHATVTVEVGVEGPALARCLAQLAPIATTRKSSLAGGAIVTFAPGFELELMWRNEKLVYVAGLWPRDGDRGAPTITTQAFEALRKTGTTQLDAALATKIEGSASAWIKICLDEKGEITAKFLASSEPKIAIGEQILAATADWTFRPFMHRKKPIAACSFTLLTYPATNAPAVEKLPTPPVLRIPSVTDNDSPIWDELESPYDFTGIQISGQLPSTTITPAALETKRLRGSKQINPDATTQAEMTKTGRPAISASVKVCVDTSGMVISTAIVKASGFVDYDTKLTREVRRWAFKAFSTPVCSTVTFVYRQKP